MFDNLITRITSPSSRRRHTYHCPEVHSDPEENEPVTPRKPRLLERRKRSKKGLLESGLRQARSLGRLDGIKEDFGLRKTLQNEVQRPPSYPLNNYWLIVLLEE
ncbi:hypothetical protein HHI36_013969 [Cryptolaemus montrouzieri]|uniref:Uncharacterized protein n=1 Tax=Cryptolaemus montrouzieri TaxID=559131 RepID=A0ABD2N1F4_9CUCU